jgi:hypothetical protein
VAGPAKGCKNVRDRLFAARPSASSTRIAWAYCPKWAVGALRQLRPPPPRNRVQLRPRAPELWAGPTAGRAEMRRKLRETREGPSRHHPSREESWERETPHIQLPASPESSYATEFCGRLPSLPGQREARKTWRGCRQDLAPRWRRPPASGINCYGHTRSNAPRAEAGASRLARVQRAVRARMRARQPRADAGDRALFCIPGA